MGASHHGGNMHRLIGIAVLALVAGACSGAGDAVVVSVPADATFCSGFEGLDSESLIGWSVDRSAASTGTRAD